MFETAQKYIPINWSLASNPVNWVIVILMVAIAGLAVAYIFPHSGGTKQENQT